MRHFPQVGGHVDQTPGNVRYGTYLIRGISDVAWVASVTLWHCFPIRGLSKNVKSGPHQLQHPLRPCGLGVPAKPRPISKYGYPARFPARVRGTSCSMKFAIANEK